MASHHPEQSWSEVLLQLTVFTSAAVVTGKGCLFSIMDLLTCHTQAYPNHCRPATLKDRDATIHTFETAFSLE